MHLKEYVAEALEPSLLFGIIPALMGIAAARYYGGLNIGYAALALAGVILAQMSANMIDDYIDFRSGLDKDTVKTKFSGGSAAMVEGKIKPHVVLLLGIIAFVLALAIGAYLVNADRTLLPIVAVGALSVLLYAKYLARIPFMSEPITGLNFALVAIGTYIAAGGYLGFLYSFVFAAFASGIQVSAAIVANYLPDIKADKKHGRRSGVVMIGNKHGIAAYYVAIEALAFGLIVAGVAFAHLPIGSLIALITLPLSLAVACGIMKYKNQKTYGRTIGNSVILELGIMLILAIAFV